jgi:HD-GYP domain-containing protein (c-di-GMP phosphodiesterase class II)
MTAVERSGEAGSALAFDTTADEVVGDHRRERGAGLTARDRLAVLALGGGFLGAAVALTFLLDSGRSPGLAVAALYVAVYAVVSRVEFEVFTGAAAPTQLVLVPMLFVLPLPTVAPAVACGLVLGSIGDSVTQRAALERSSLQLMGAWHAVGPVLVLAAAGEHAPALSSAAVYAFALGTQFALETVVICAYELITRGARPADVLPHLARVQAVDALLAPVGLAFAFVATGPAGPFALLLVLPLVALLQVFARERRARIDNALELSAAYRGTALLLGDVVEADDAYTGLHSRDVVDLAVAVADELGLPPGDRRDAELTALLHDVGKIRMPAEIIGKDGPLTAEERAVMETHTLEGERLLEQVGGLLGHVGRLVRSCHERWDGSGYPDGLAGEEIPPVARIVMGCDAFSAMTTDRSYRRALPVAAALEELRANAGTQFDPAVVAALVAVVGRGVARPVRKAGERYLGSGSSL